MKSFKQYLNESLPNDKIEELKKFLRDNGVDDTTTNNVINTVNPATSADGTPGKLPAAEPKPGETEDNPVKDNKEATDEISGGEDEPEAQPRVALRDMEGGLENAKEDAQKQIQQYIDAAVERYQSNPGESQAQAKINNRAKQAINQKLLKLQNEVRKARTSSDLKYLVNRAKAEVDIIGLTSERKVTSQKNFTDTKKAIADTAGKVLNGVKTAATAANNASKQFAPTNAIRNVLGSTGKTVFGTHVAKDSNGKPKMVSNLGATSFGQKIGGAARGLATNVGKVARNFADGLAAGNRIPYQDNYAQPQVAAPAPVAAIPEAPPGTKAPSWIQAEKEAAEKKAAEKRTRTRATAAATAQQKNAIKRQASVETPSKKSAIQQAWEKRSKRRSL